MGAKSGKKKPVVEVADSGYQPTKAEMEEEIKIEASPEELARAVMSSVEIRVVRPEKVKKG